MNIKRTDRYDDCRFSKTALCQHGAYLIGEDPYEVVITDRGSAVVYGKDPAVYRTLIEEFRFHAPHICRFYDKDHELISAYPEPDLFDIPLEKIQPSQFFVDEEKLEAVRTFIRCQEDIVIQVMPYGGRYISLDGHTRLYLAAVNGYDKVKAVISETDETIWIFVHEAERRKILRPEDMILLSHEQYEIRWNRYCDEVFAGIDRDGGKNV